MKKEKEAQEKAEKQRLAKEEAERLAAEKKKKKPIRYPTEDLDIQVSDKDKKAGTKVQRPLASRALPFNETPGVFESFLLAWNFLVVYGYVLMVIILKHLPNCPPDNPFICRASHWTSLRQPSVTPTPTSLATFSPKSIPPSSTT